MKRWLKILLVFTLMLVCRENALPSSGVATVPVIAETGEITQKESPATDDTRIQDLYLCAQGYEYTVPEHFSSSARLRSGGTRRTAGSAKVFIKARSLVNLSNPVGFVQEQSSFISGTLSSASHFILLRNSGSDCRTPLSRRPPGQSGLHHRVPGPSRTGGQYPPSQSTIRQLQS